MNSRTLMNALAACLIALAPFQSNAAGVDEATKSELVHTGELLLGFTYMTVASGDADGALSGAVEASHVARLADNPALLARAENHERAYRGIGLLVTSDAARSQGHELIAPELKELGCRLLNDVLPGEVWLGPIVEKVKELCAGVARDATGSTAEVDAEKSRLMLEVAARLLDVAQSTHRADPANAVGHALVARDMTRAAGREDVVRGVESLVFVYETLALARLAKVFDEEQVLPLASGRLRALACGMTKDADPSLAPMVEELRRRCFI